VVCVALPLAGLTTVGVAHIKMPKDLVHTYSTGGEVMGWLQKAKDGEQFQLHQDNWLRRSLTHVFPGADIQNPSLKRIDWEANNWHFDISPGLTDSTNYDIQATVGPLERAGRKRQSFLCTIPFPVDWQGPTVTVPWAGEYEGKSVQAPKGYATIFDPHACWHRGDRWLGSRRGLLLQCMTKAVRNRRAT